MDYISPCRHETWNWILKRHFVLLIFNEVYYTETASCVRECVRPLDGFLQLGTFGTQGGHLILPMTDTVRLSNARTL